MRNKLISIIADAQDGDEIVKLGAIADALLASGVIKDKWTPISVEKPEKGNITHKHSDYLCTVLIPSLGGAYRKEIKALSYDAYQKRWNCEGMIVTHWMPAPDPAE